MRILMISDVYFPRINGVSTSIKSFRDELIVQGHEVYLIAPEYVSDKLNHYIDDENILRIKSRQVVLDPEDRLMNRKKILSYLPDLKNKQFDILHIHTPFVAHYAGLELARLLNIPVVETYHTYFEEYLYHYIPFLPKKWLKGLARRFTRSQCNKVNAVVVPSNAMQKALTNYGVTCDLSIIPTGLNLADFDAGDADDFRKKYNIEDERPLLVHIGRVAHEKNIDFLVHMTDQLRHTIADVLLVITGEGPSLSHLKSLVQKLGLENNVLFVGYLSREKELLDCYKAGDIFVFASHTETQGLVLLEAMACGTPVVSQAKMGTVDILKPEVGAIIAEDDQQDFVTKVLMLLQNKPLRIQMGQDAVKYAATWSAQKMTHKVLNFYQDTMNMFASVQPGNTEHDITVEHVVDVKQEAS